MSEAYSARTKYDERVATRYRHEAEGRRGRENAVLRSILDEVGLQGTLLDAPCGTGRVVDVLGGRLRRYVGLDLSTAMLSECGRRILDLAETFPAGIGRADLERLPLAERSIDVTLCLRFLHHLPPATRGKVLDELARVTDRILVVTFFHPFALHFLERKVKDLIRRRPNPRFSNTTGWLEERLAGRGFRLRSSRGTGLLRETRYAVFERRDEKP